MPGDEQQKPASPALERESPAKPADATRRELVVDDLAPGDDGEVKGGGMASWNAVSSGTLTFSGNSSGGGAG